MFGKSIWWYGSSCNYEKCSRPWWKYCKLSKWLGLFVCFVLFYCILGAKRVFQKLLLVFGTILIICVWGNAMLLIFCICLQKRLEAIVPCLLCQCELEQLDHLVHLFPLVHLSVPIFLYQLQRLRWSENIIPNPSSFHPITLTKVRCCTRHSLLLLNKSKWVLFGLQKEACDW